ncbi:hypothetical protein M9H77_34450 [Catharanthus roseus]|uniref:Uncharacterized protein n=1 Tax=Catharanthus roseus TaxID=4058 RepID=A0ACB9ZPU0_CATRO|nr:hypothetical protein M9H77_34450 [Catharanthus roseus]
MKGHISCQSTNEPAFVTTKEQKLTINCREIFKSNLNEKLFTLCSFQHDAVVLPVKLSILPLHSALPDKRKRKKKKRRKHTLEEDRRRRHQSGHAVSALFKT